MGLEMGGGERSREVRVGMRRVTGSRSWVFPQNAHPCSACLPGSHSGELLKLWRWEDDEDALLVYGLFFSTLLAGAQPAVQLWAWADLPYFVALASTTIYIGAHRGLNAKQQQISLKQGALAPILASVSLFSIYLVIKYMPDLDLQHILDAYFWLLGTVAVAGGLAGPARTLVSWLPGRAWGRCRRWWPGASGPRVQRRHLARPCMLAKARACVRCPVHPGYQSSLWLGVHSADCPGGCAAAGQEAGPAQLAGGAAALAAAGRGGAAADAGRGGTDRRAGGCPGGGPGLAGCGQPPPELHGQQPDWLHDCGRHPAGGVVGGSRGSRGGGTEGAAVVVEGGWARNSETGCARLYSRQQEPRLTCSAVLFPPCHARQPAYPDAATATRRGPLTSPTPARHTCTPPPPPHAQLVGLRSFRVAAVLLLGMLAYDWFWVFESSKAVGENVMLQGGVLSSVKGGGVMRLPAPLVGSEEGRRVSACGEVQTAGAHLCGCIALPPPPAPLPQPRSVCSGHLQRHLRPHAPALPPLPHLPGRGNRLPFQPAGSG